MKPNLFIDKANSVTLYIVAATNFVNYKDVSADQHARVDKYLAGISGKDHTQLSGKTRSMTISKLFDRVKLSLARDRKFLYLPTDKRMVGLESNPDPANLAALAYQFGRYLLISSSRYGYRTRKSSGHLERKHEPKLGFEIYHQHQYRDELLARGIR
jgi:alpha-L-fucosidase 2